MTLHWEEPEQGKKLMNELCSKMVDEYYFEVGPYGDLAIVLDGRYFPVSSSTDVLSYNISAGSGMGHVYILMHLTNDRTQEKRQVAVVICPLRVYTYRWPTRDSTATALQLVRFTQAYVEMSNIKTNDKVQSPRIMILSKSVAVNNPDKTFAAGAAKPVDQTTQRAMVGQLIIDRLNLEPFIIALTIMSMSELQVDDVLIHKIDTCMHCAKYILKLKQLGTSVKTISKDFEILKRLDKELPLHVCQIGMGYYSDQMNGFHFREQSFLSSILYSIRLKTATPKDLVKYHKRDCVPVDPKQVEICKQFILERCKKTDRINKHWSSYGFKHAVELWTVVKNNRSSIFHDYDYVSNGAFIRAALDLGYRCEYSYGIGPMVCLNISLRGEE